MSGVGRRKGEEEEEKGAMPGRAMPCWVLWPRWAPGEARTGLMEKVLPSGPDPELGGTSSVTQPPVRVPQCRVHSLFSQGQWDMGLPETPKSIWGQFCQVLHYSPSCLLLNQPKVPEGPYKAALGLLCPLSPRQRRRRSRSKAVLFLLALEYMKASLVAK